jgi:hypothetical protein
MTNDLRGVSIGADRKAFGSRTVSYNPLHHSGVGFRRDF